MPNAHWRFAVADSPMIRQEIDSIRESCIARNKDPAIHDLYELYPPENNNVN